MRQKIKKSNSNNNIFVKPKSIYSNQKKIRRLKENNSNKNNEVNNNKRCDEKCRLFK